MKGPADLLLRLLDGIVYERPLLVGDDAVELADRLATGSAPPAWTAACPGRRRTPPTAGAATPFAARALPFEQPFPDRSFDLVVAAGWIEPLPSPARTLVELKRVSSRHLLVIVADRAEPLDEERLAGLIAAAGLRVRKTRRGAPGLLGALAERPD